MSDESNEAKWTETRVVIDAPGGRREVPALIHPKAPGIAVTEFAIGTFSVTHIGTGLKISGPFERMANAMLMAAKVSLCADWTQPPAVVAEQLKGEAGQAPFPLDGHTMTTMGVSRPWTKMEMVQDARGWAGVMDEFPEEDDDPMWESEKILGQHPEVAASR